MTGHRFETVAQDLRERIADGRTGPGGALDSEAEIGRRHGVSRVTVRRALEGLRDEGLVVSRAGSGWYVAGTPLRQRLGVGVVRHAPSAVAATGAVAHREVLAFRYIVPPPEARDLLVPDDTEGGPDEVLHVRSRRRTTDVDDRTEPLDLTDEWVPAALAGPVSRDDAADPGLWATLRRAGSRVDVVRQSVSAAVAGPDDAELLQLDVGAPLLVVRRLAVGPSGPLALAVHRYVAHRFSLDVDLAGWPDEPRVTTPTPDRSSS